MMLIGIGILEMVIGMLILALQSYLIPVNKM